MPTVRPCIATPSRPKLVQPLPYKQHLPSHTHPHQYCPQLVLPPLLNIEGHAVALEGAVRHRVVFGAVGGVQHLRGGLGLFRV